MLPKRKPTAIPHYDYSQPGAYFITLCVEKRRPILGKIDSSPQVVLSSIGKIVSDVWYSLPQRFPCLDAIETNRLLETPGQKLWQRSAYEHILRNQQDFDKAAGYIQSNPGRRVERGTGP